MYRYQHFVVILSLLLAVLLCSCSNGNTVSDTSAPTGTTSEITSSVIESTSKDTGSETGSTPSETTDTSEVPGTSSGGGNETKPPQSTGGTTETPGTTSSPTTYPPATSSPTTEPPTTEPTEKVHIKSIAAALSEYISVNEAKPYVKSKPIYEVLHGGSRAQVGDTLVFKVTVSPAVHDGVISIDAGDNLTATLSGNTLTVKVKSAGQYGNGSVSIYGLDPDGRGIDAQCNIRFSVDATGNPFDNLSSVISNYIQVKKMEVTTVGGGYTKDDPSLSITAFPGAPAWDDCIYKSDSNYISRCFWLIDEYASRGFKKVNFIITEEQIGFAAC